MEANNYTSLVGEIDLNNAPVAEMSAALANVVALNSRWTEDAAMLAAPSVSLQALIDASATDVSTLADAVAAREQAISHLPTRDIDLTRASLGELNATLAELQAYVRSWQGGLYIKGNPAYGALNPLYLDPVVVANIATHVNEGQAAIEAVTAAIAALN